MKKEQNSDLKHPLSLLPSKPAGMVLDFLEHGVGTGGTNLPWGDKPRAKAGPVNERVDGSRVKGKFGSECCDLCSARERQQGCLWDDSKSSGKEPLSVGQGSQKPAQILS